MRVKGEGVGVGEGEGEGEGELLNSQPQTLNGAHLSPPRSCRAVPHLPH